jgi:hypothetical protein
LRLLTGHETHAVENRELYRLARIRNGGKDSLPQGRIGFDRRYDDLSGELNRVIAKIDLTRVFASAVWPGFSAEKAWLIRAHSLCGERARTPVLLTLLLELLPLLRRSGKFRSPLGVFSYRSHFLFVTGDNLAGGTEHLDLAMAKP